MLGNCLLLKKAAEICAIFIAKTAGIEFRYTSLISGLATLTRRNFLEDTLTGT